MSSTIEMANSDVPASSLEMMISELNFIFRISTATTNTSSIDHLLMISSRFVTDFCAGSLCPAST